jgi:hypothetical protein
MRRALPFVGKVKNERNPNAAKIHKRTFCTHNSAHTLLVVDADASGLRCGAGLENRHSLMRLKNRMKIFFKKIGRNFLVSEVIAQRNRSENAL